MRIPACPRIDIEKLISTGDDETRATLILAMTAEGMAGRQRSDLCRHDAALHCNLFFQRPRLADLLAVGLVTAF
jgi:hypothetical protein